MGDAAVLEAPPQAQVQPRPAAAPVQPQVQARAKPQQDDDLPPWVTEFSDDSAVPAGPSHIGAELGQPAAPAAPAAAPQQRAPAQARPPYEYVITPVPQLNWDGNWPLLAAHLPLRGVSQQLATQAELVNVSFDGNMAVFRLRCPIDTWSTPANVEKLTVALSERFNHPMRVDVELGKAWYTTSAEAQAHREACQRAAEETVANDPFVKSMVRDFGAFIVPGSIVAPMTPAH
jgi:DNA polymerase-3 subunit gamma/tau